MPEWEAEDFDETGDLKTHQRTNGLFESRFGPAGGWMTTFTGRQISFINPLQEQICIEDIAHHLSMICHWGGAAKEFISVAQHSVLVSRIVPWELQRWALLHDAAEAYCGDMIRPLKALLPEYKQIEARLMTTIAAVFKLPWPVPSAIKMYDDRILRFESTLFMHANEVLHDGHGRPVNIPKLMPNELQRIPMSFRQSMSPLEAEMAFLARYRRIFLDDDGL